MVMEIAKWAASCFLLACGAPLQAHHSSALFDLSMHTWLKGRVTSYEAINPHARITLEVADDKGDVRQWTIEGPRLGRIERLGIDGDFVSVGDVIEVCGFFAKGGNARSSRVHGHVVVLANGEMWQWGPYGRLELCVHPDDWDSIATGSNPLRGN